MSIFETLSGINVNKLLEKKNGLKYLSWPYAWAEVKKRYPDVQYEIVTFNGVPYFYDENLGYMVFTSITIGCLTHEMWLPVMDGANKAMKNKPYTYDTKYKKGGIVEAATMFDINKTIMRCLAKNLAMFGLGLYIYAGEDLPEIETEKISAKDANILKSTINAMDKSGKMYASIINRYKIKSFKELTVKQRTEILDGLREMEKRGENNAQKEQAKAEKNEPKEKAP